MATMIPARPDEVWADVRDLGSHVEWMADAEAIRFTSTSRSGVGTTFDCDTKVGPFHLVDQMEVTEWAEGEVIGVHHVGLVTGSGRFTLCPVGAATRFAWEEELAIPWWLGGPLASVALRLVWMRNLRRLRRRF
ncbi:MAG: Polyketide cyclase / dehydrase and lipid transport [Actinomycetia bacterium]|nr:Polyketide cyclase / dehydrase and lipid transport [Actinomycetes bacterium]